MSEIPQGEELPRASGPSETNKAAKQQEKTPVNPAQTPESVDVTAQNEPQGRVNPLPVTDGELKQAFYYRPRPKNPNDVPRRCKRIGFQ